MRTRPVVLRAGASDSSGLDMRLGTAARSPVLQTALGVAELWNAIEKLGWLLRSTVKTRSLLSGNCVGDMSAATLTWIRRRILWPTRRLGSGPVSRTMKLSESAVSAWVQLEY
jgi:hypothetical protein